MKVLDCNSFYYTLARCCDNEDYRAVIVFATVASKMEFINEFVKAWENNSIPGVVKVGVSYDSDASRIFFKNGSIIELITLTENVRGVRYNEVIYEGGVDITDDRVRGLLQCMLTPYRCGAYESMDGRPLTDMSWLIDRLRRYEGYKEAAQRSEELDEFLGSFSVTE